MKYKFLILFCLFLFSLSLYAEEGMWLLTQLELLQLQKKGLKIDLKTIYDPEKPCIVDAIVLLGGGTSEFVSKDGLMLTNHHVAFGSVQRASTEGTDYITDGFLANSMDEEIQAPGLTAQIIKEMRDVTDEILAVVKDITDPIEKDKAINTKIQQMTDELEEDRDDVNAQIASMYNGKQYVLFVYQRFEDVRIVYIPPESIGNYGGDIDNWMWPRHTGDFSFMRVYMSPDGKGVKYSKDNIPYKPKYWLKISKDHLQDGDLTFTLGYPGYTTRYRTSNSVRWNLTYNYPEIVQRFQEIIDLLNEVTKDDPEGQIKIASLNRRLNNTMKNFQGKIEGMTKTNFLDKKIAFEKELMTYINSKPELKTKYGHILIDIENEYKKLKQNKLEEDFIQRLQSLSGTILETATNIYGFAREREKPADERDPNFSEKDVERIAERLHFQYMSYHEPADKALFIKALKDASVLDTAHQITCIDKIIRKNKRPIEQFVEQAYQNTKLKNVEYTKSLFKKTSEELEKLDDPFISLVKDCYDLSDRVNDRYEKFGAAITELRKQYIDALYAWKGKSIYPDANRTIRFSYGPIAGYKPADAVWYEPFTTLKGVIDKNTGEEPFNMPIELEKLYQNKDYGQWMDPVLKDIPVAFTHIVDQTGGSSGSPVINAKGELIGISFDGNYEAMTSDWQYDNDIQRAISVDIRYVMFITEKLAGADHILKELDVK